MMKGFKKILKHRKKGDQTPAVQVPLKTASKEAASRAASSDSFKSAEEKNGGIEKDLKPQKKPVVEKIAVPQNPAQERTTRQEVFGASSNTQSTSGSVASRDSLEVKRVSDISESKSFVENKGKSPRVSFSHREQGLLTSSVLSMEGMDEALDDPEVASSYDAIPLLDQIHLPRGGITIETEAVGMIQFGIPPETIKDSMRIGLPVPSVYIVPVERFCREMGPALGVNLAEFEFPAYFNFFVNKKQCTLIVDSDDAELNIRRVFSETLLGPAEFRREKNPITYNEEDFAPDFPREAIPNFEKELKHFRTMPGGKELVLETLLKFCHFSTPGKSSVHNDLGIPPPLVAGNGETGDGPEPDLADVATSELDDNGLIEDFAEEVDIPKDEDEIASHEEKTPWTYSQARWTGDIATVYPSGTTEEQKQTLKAKRVEIFKMPGGTEYIIHDVDENNHIVGKARFAGHVKVSETMAVDGFSDMAVVHETEEKKASTKSAEEAEDEESISSADLISGMVGGLKTLETSIPKHVTPPTFHPPSFGLTVLGNSHGFDKSGSVSGYVLWVNGRGVMIDPPPYASATLEREGIRPRTIVGIILTHCHADHDAGAFQKVLTGSPVTVITTPTIYKSFIRKYAALSALSPALLRHSHRHKPAIIGAPLRFQGATFHFTYSLHTIPCIGFRVEWRGRSMVFTGDHFNSPPAMEKLEEDGVLSAARASDLRNLSLQDTDLLLHEAGAPPIHTPLDVLMNLPQRIKNRMYVVHTSTLPKDCDLRVAPTGTAGTIRLDQLEKSHTAQRASDHRRLSSADSAVSATSISLQDDGMFSSSWGDTSKNEYDSIDSIPEEPISDDRPGRATHDMMNSFAHLAFDNKNPLRAGRNSISITGHQPPLVSLRPASSTDAWFILNLLSAVPFLTSLSYASTMEVLETARVDAYCKNDVIVPISRRNDVLCVIWEGACVEQDKHAATRGDLALLEEEDSGSASSGSVGSSGDLSESRPSVWYAGDWTGPLALQPEKELSGESVRSKTHDVVAMSKEGVKVISIEFSELHAILLSGSVLYGKYLDRRAQRKRSAAEPPQLASSASQMMLDEAVRNLNVLELLNCNSALRKLTAVQKRHLECLAEGPRSFEPGERMWRAGGSVDMAFVIVSGTASFVPKRRNAGSAGGHFPPARPYGSAMEHKDSPAVSSRQRHTVGESMRHDAMLAIQELNQAAALLLDPNADEESIESIEHEAENARRNLVQLDSIFGRGNKEGFAALHSETSDFDRVSRGLQERAKMMAMQESNSRDPSSSSLVGQTVEGSDEFSTEGQDSFTELADFSKQDDKNRRSSLLKRRSSRARFANKVLGRLYSRRAFTSGFVFSRGHFLGDVSKMVAGLLSCSDSMDPVDIVDPDDQPKYGFEGMENHSGHSRHRSILSDITIHEQVGSEHTVHSSTLTAGKEGCVVLVFPKANLIPFLDEYPGLLLSLLGTQVVV